MSIGQVYGKNDILRKLFWQFELPKETERRETGYLKLGSRYNIPSWSWAYIDGPVKNFVVSYHQDMGNTHFLRAYPAINFMAHWTAIGIGVTSHRHNLHEIFYLGFIWVLALAITPFFDSYSEKYICLYIGIMAVKLVPQ